ncbi:hypothetical protein GCWU000324_00928 [Kingella oralis ATCC 51147]|uniref:Uncharacterized protein n=1 Tax=Kingella oralis ATCC 51147 TaxID=629741 RepID=C4GFL2_9NEIS|nr:hypothetical protein GCWU000324_00928 [Kingella oralis ATCC 51147]
MQLCCARRLRQPETQSTQQKYPTLPTRSIFSGCLNSLRQPEK